MVAPESSGAEVIGRAGQIFRRHLAGPAWIYYLCTAPFVLAAIEFVSSLSEGLVIPGEIARRALILCGLFWLKSAGQAVYCRIALAEQSGVREDWPAARVIRLAVVSGAAQSLMFPVSIVSSVLFVTFGVTSAMCQHLFILAGDPDADLKPAVRRSYAMAMEDVLSQHAFWSLAGILYLIVFVNLLVLFHLIPALLKTLFNIDTVFSMATVSMLNTTYLSLVLGFTYLAVDPIVKLGYVIYHDRGVSRRSGADLIARLRSIKPAVRAAAAFLLAILAATAAQAGPAIERQLSDGPEDSPAVNRAYYAPLLNVYREKLSGAADTSELLWISDLLRDTTWTPDTVKFLKRRVKHLSEPAPARPLSGAGADRDFAASIQTIFDADKYRWRVVLESRPEEKDGLFAPLFRWLGRPVKAALRWLNGILKKIGRWILDWIFRIRGRSDPSDLPAVPYYLEMAGLLFVFVLTAILAIVLIRQRKKFARPAGAAPSAAPDLEADRVDARNLGLDDWMALAEAMLRENKPALALRAVFLATLSNLNEKRMIRFEPHKTNGAYLGEFGRSTALSDNRIPVFGDMVRTFECVWYGSRPVTPNSYALFKSWNQSVTAESAPRA